MGARLRNEPQRWVFNRLQEAAATLSPWIERLHRAFDKLDFVAHQLSGSGSAYFGVCRHAGHARRLATILRARHLGLVYATRSCA
jgi:4-diphosphocytidyl-2-C-methyl-D-erythritol kinase